MDFSGFGAAGQAFPSLEQEARLANLRPEFGLQVFLVAWVSGVGEYLVPVFDAGHGCPPLLLDCTEMLLMPNSLFWWELELDRTFEAASAVGQFNAYSRVTPHSRRLAIYRWSELESTPARTPRRSIQLTGWLAQPSSCALALGAGQTEKPNDLYTKKPPLSGTSTEGG